MYWTSSNNFVNRWVILTLVLGCFLSIYVTYRVHTSNQEIIYQSAEQASEEVLQQVMTRIQLYQYGLRSVRGVVLTAGEKTIMRDDFYQYSITRDIDEEFPGANGFGFIRRVPQESMPEYLSHIQASSWPNFKVKELSSNFSERYIIEFVEPIGRNQQAIGLDIASEVNRREAALSAINDGEVRLTGPITLVQASGKTLQSALILMPIYRNGKIPKDMQSRYREGFGWSYAPLIMEDVLMELDIDQSKIHFELYDITDLDDQVGFYSNDKEGSIGQMHVAEMDIYGRKWQNRLSVTDAFIHQLRLSDPYVFLFFGIAISGLAAILVAVVRVNIARRQEVIAHQSRITAVVESSADGIISLNLDGIITSWNRGAEQIYGYKKREVIGLSALQTLVPSELQNDDKKMFQRVRQQKQALSIETRIRTKSGAQVPVSLTISPIFDANEYIIGVSQSVRDISERKKSEAKIRELNISLEDQVKARTAELEDLNLLLNDVLQASSEISIIATDDKGLITLFNKGSERMLGYQADEVLGKRTPVVFYTTPEIDEHRAAIFEEYGTYVSDPLEVLIYKAKLQGYDSQEWTFVHKSGSRHPVSLVITPMKNARGDIIGYLGMAMDISEQKKNQQALVAARDQLLIAAEVAQLGVWSWDLEQDVLEWSDMMYDIYHYPKNINEDGVTLFDWQARLHPEDKEKTLNHFQQSVRDSKLYSDVFRIILPDGRVRYIQAGAYIEKNSQGNALRLTGVNQDITTERELETWLRHAKDEADAASAAKSTFLANMSHEIRTPMNAILGMLQLVKRTALSDQQDDYISKAQISAQSLLGLINDVLDFSKVDAGKLELEQAAFDVEALLCELSTVLSGSPIRDHVELIFDVDPDLPSHFIGDKLRLLQILINLLSNAIKFTLKGCITLEIRCLHQQQGIAKLAIAVKDTGIGISKENIDSIFDVFSQAESSTTRRFGGTGLGLVICRRFVELMGGQLNVDSQFGEGSCFYFSIDLPIADLPSTKSIHRQSMNQKDIKVLIAESHLASQIILTRMAQNLGWQTETTDDFGLISHLLEQAHSDNKPFDVLLIDVKLSDFHGQPSLDLLYQSLPSEIRLPKSILLLNTSSDNAHENALPNLVKLFKPVTLSRLSESVYQVLAVEPIVEDVSAIDQEEHKSLHGINLLLVEDNEFNRQVASELLAIEGANVVVARGGKEGVSMVLNQKTPMFDLVLMDMQMPDVDGLEATREIRMDQRFVDLPIVAMTANVSIADRQACLDAGMNDHLGKPLDIEQIIACILQLIPEKAILISAANEQQAPLSNTSVDPSEMNVAEAEKIAMIEESLDTKGTVEAEKIEDILDRFGGSVELYQSLVSGFETEANTLISQIELAIEKDNVGQLIEALHSLKGSALTMGLVMLSAAVGKYETELKAASDPHIVSMCVQGLSQLDIREMMQSELVDISGRVEEFADY
ncbi:PAS domain-containing hybrid sensor histidine kinase/response regulator [Marinomonas posidonica]|uniref:Sensory/regulatory protein RpfC n=1 Tax=Marinomonas posidonica (strain CECT 7376 / NCIMB 14433 / IVIA-Po-181) TaxID=491952 RepID=F6CU31_MARPP|nr:PAS domain S-box protein [Marinomonas posidonica]AEF54083.1 multi-sensor hybrid histidine kinase [Marinomonas posidonica IVIA-Po-181]